MAKIFISLSGEGRGHATRVSTLVHHLEKEHDVAVFAPGLAYEFLKPLQRRGLATVDSIEGLLNSYAPCGRWDYWKTFCAGRAYFSRLPTLVRRLVDRVRADRPDLVITDFEPALPRAAEECGVPYMSVSHQHFMVVNDLSCLPLDLRLHAFWMGLGVRGFYWRQSSMVVSSFFYPPLKPQYRHVVQAGVLLRPEVMKARVREGDHLVVYIRRNLTPGFVDALRSTGLLTLVYGPGRRPRCGNVVFKEIDGAAFVEDLASARALICTAGNQIVGEALYLGKPTLVMPEPNNHEQRINAFFAAQMGAADSMPMEEVNVRHLHQFLARSKQPLSSRDRRRMNGTPVVLDAIRRQIEWGGYRQYAPGFCPSEARVA